ncbi:hypothetical protein COU57_01840 [Candidatus Pacearchaeota archaeon CG10_big_fil_rev_8_21_14_0_10_32_14]|nr:MAG: hypothetical protein COU57_01840 [Candidatus Pacearchaeota archaeon CG10_big_fil_rev_8_21_14_0_10_32_14]
MLLWVIVAVIAFAVIIVVYYYNRFTKLSNRIDNSLSQIDVQLKRRADLIPNLIESVKGYMKHEKAAIKAVTDARTVMMGAKDLPGKVKANNVLEGALKTIFALAENYPDLKANTNFLELQRELASTEDRVAYSRQFYNDSILEYENKRKTFPGNFFANTFGFKEKEYIKIAEAERKVVKVDFE